MWTLIPGRYEFCEKFELYDATKLDRICYKKRAEKLAEAYKTRPLTTPIEEIWPERTYREIHSRIKKQVDTRVNEVRETLHSGIFRKRSDVARAASLAYHGLLGLPGSHRGLRLSNKICSNLNSIEQDLPKVPAAHLASLKASVRFAMVSFIEA